MTTHTHTQHLKALSGEWEQSLPCAVLPDDFTG